MKYSSYSPAGPPREGPRPVSALSACEMAETSSCVMRCPLSAASWISATVGISKLMTLRESMTCFVEFRWITSCCSAIYFSFRVGDVTVRAYQSTELCLPSSVVGALRVSRLEQNIRRFDQTKIAGGAQCPEFAMSPGGRPPATSLQIITTPWNEVWSKANDHSQFV